MQSKLHVRKTLIENQQQVAQGPTLTQFKSFTIVGSIFEELPTH